VAVVQRDDPELGLDGSSGRNLSSSTSSGTSYCSPTNAPPARLTGQQTRKLVANEKKRYAGAVRTSPRKGYPATFW
jgi:hypothetical protein